MGRVWEGPLYPESGVLGRQGWGALGSVPDCLAVCPGGTLAPGAGLLVWWGLQGPLGPGSGSSGEAAAGPPAPCGGRSHPPAGRGEPLGPHHFGFIHSELAGETMVCPDQQDVVPNASMASSRCPFSHQGTACSAWLLAPPDGCPSGERKAVTSVPPGDLRRHGNPGPLS